MSQGLICDQCGEVLAVDSKGDDGYGESAAWLKVKTGFDTYDVCTRACLVALAEDEDFIAACEAHAEGVADVARIIREANDD